MVHTRRTGRSFCDATSYAWPPPRAGGARPIFLHHGSWYVYYWDGARQVRRRIGPDASEASQVAAPLNAELSRGSQTLRPFDPITVAELRQRFLDHHESVLHSSLATVSRYRTATAYAERFAGQQPNELQAHELESDGLIRWLRTLHVAPNGHSNSRKRSLQEKGIRFILETCRGMYRYAAKRRHLPPYFENPFSELAAAKVHADDAAPVFIFDAATEARFLGAADRWSFPIHFTLSKTGLRPGELAHLLIEELDLDQGWLQVRGKPELRWRVKTRRERAVPLVQEVVDVLRHVIGGREAGPVFQRPRFQQDSASPAANHNREALAHILHERIAAAETQWGRRPTRDEDARIARTVWRDAGAIRSDDIRTSFIRIAKSVGLQNVTCPKSWRHSFATLLQDANVDPLIRQITLGHAPSAQGNGGLGMTAVYTHTRAETQEREIERAVRLWPQALQIAREWLEGVPS